MTNEFPRLRLIADVAKSKGLSNLTWGPKCLQSRSSFIFLWSGVLSKSENYCGRLTLLSEMPAKISHCFQIVKNIILNRGVKWDFFWWFSTTVFLQYLTTNWFGFVLFSKSSCLILKTIFDYWHFRLKQNFSQFIAKIMSSHEPLLPPWFLTYLLPAKWFLKNTTTSSMMMVLRKKVGSGSIQDDAMIFSHWKWNLLIFRKMLFKTSLDLDFTSRWIFNGGSKSFAMKWPSISAKKNKIRPFTFWADMFGSQLLNVANFGNS